MITLEDLQEFLKFFVPLFSAAGLAFAALWTRVTKHMDSQKEDLDECHRERKVTDLKVLDLTERVGKLEGRVQGRTEGVLELAQAVVAKIRED